jgi:hypothetical protein
MTPSDKLSKELILAALTRLRELLREKGVIGELCIIDNATRVIAFAVRNPTDDPKAGSATKTAVLNCARQVANELDLQEDWMNPGASGFISELEEVTHDGITISYRANPRQDPAKTINSHETSLCESMLFVSNSVDFDDALAIFLNQFNGHPTTEVLVKEPPPLATVLDDNGLADAYLAATAAWLANKNRLSVPAWAKGSSRALETPWFAARSHKLRMLLLQESPSEFRLRNLFVSANALHRA